MLNIIYIFNEVKRRTAKFYSLSWYEECHKDMLVIIVVGFCVMSISMWCTLTVLGMLSLSYYVMHMCDVIVLVKTYTSTCIYKKSSTKTVKILELWVRDHKIFRTCTCSMYSVSQNVIYLNELSVFPQWLWTWHSAFWSITRCGCPCPFYSTIAGITRSK